MESKAAVTLQFEHLAVTNYLFLHLVLKKIKKEKLDIDKKILN